MLKRRPTTETQSKITPDSSVSLCVSVVEKSLFRSSTFDFQLVAGARLGSSKAGSQNAEWRAGDIVHAHLVAELNRGRIAAVFAANSNLEATTLLPSPFDSDLNQFSHSFTIDHRERILFENALLEIGWQYLVHVVAREAEGGLGEVVGAEAEELSYLGNLARQQRGTRQLDHGSDEVVHLFAFL